MRSDPAADRLIINAAVTGMVPMPERVPHVPIPPEQIVEDVVSNGEWPRLARRLLRR